MTRACATKPKKRTSKNALAFALRKNNVDAADSRNVATPAYVI